MFLSRHKWAILGGVLGLALVVWLTWTIRRNQARKLDLPRLETARALWNDKGPKTYVLHYSIRLPDQKRR